jgi:hypothetical protein
MKLSVSITAGLVLIATIFFVVLDDHKHKTNSEMELAVSSFTYYFDEKFEDVRLVTEYKQCEPTYEHEHTGMFGGSDILRNKNLKNLVVTIDQNINGRVKPRPAFMGNRRNLAAGTSDSLNNYQLHEDLTFQIPKKSFEPFENDSSGFRYKFENPIFGDSKISIRGNLLEVRFKAGYFAKNCKDISYSLHMTGHVCDPSKPGCQN